jgi:hypothetical protein
MLAICTICTAGIRAPVGVDEEGRQRRRWLPHGSAARLCGLDASGSLEPAGRDELAAAPVHRRLRPSRV